MYGKILYFPECSQRDIKNNNPKIFFQKWPKEGAHMSYWHVLWKSGYQQNTYLEKDPSFNPIACFLYQDRALVVKLFYKNDKSMSGLLQKLAWRKDLSFKKLNFIEWDTQFSTTFWENRASRGSSVKWQTSLDIRQCPCCTKWHGRIGSQDIKGM